MPKPNIIESITVPDVVMYNETSCRISWTAASGGTSYRLEASGDGGDFSVVYSGTAASFDYDVSAVDFGRIVFRIYGVNADGDSPFLESKAVTVIDYEIEDKPNGDMILQPFELIIDSKSSRIDDVPAVRETSETITGLDGEIPVDMKYSPRLFDLVTFMKGSFGSVAEREEYIRKWSGHINRSVRKLRYLLYHGRIFGVKRISSAGTLLQLIVKRKRLSGSGTGLRLTLQGLIIWIFPFSKSGKILSAGVMRSGGGNGGLLCEKGAALCGCS